MPARTLSRTDGIYELLAEAKQLSPMLQEVATAYPYLSEAEQALVRYVLEHPSDAAAMSSGELAAATGVSPATLFRAFRQFSFGGFAALRDELQRIVAHLGDRFVHPIDARSIGAADPTATGVAFGATELDPLLEGLYQGIRALLDNATVEFHSIERAAEAIAAAKQVHLCGAGPISGGLIDMLAFTFQRMGLACMSWKDPSTMILEDQTFSNGDALVVLTHSGTNADIARFVQRAGELGATTIAITNYRRSPVAQAAKLLVVTNIRERTIQNYELLPRVSHMVLLQVLVNRVRARLTQDGSST